MYKFFLSGLLSFLVFTVFVDAQVSVAERSTILTSYGKVLWKTQPVEIPIGKDFGAGDIATINSQEFGLTNAGAIRIHFKVQTVPVPATWLLQILDNSNKVIWSFSPVQSNESEFWSTEIPGNIARIQVISIQENNPLKIVVDRIAVQQPPVVPKSITIPDDRRPITNQSDNVKKLGKAIARMRFVGDDGLQYVCTGFLISSDLFITNHHCPQSESEWRSTMLDFDFDSSAAVPKVMRFKEFVISNPDLDFAIYRLAAKQADRAPLKLDSTIPVDTTGLLIIQHPGGEPKQVSIIGCRVQGNPTSGVTSRLTDFAHLCDTLGGSSGSPMIKLPATQDGTSIVVGLHHLGFRQGDALQSNRAVLMKEIIDFIKTNRPDIKTELGL